MTWSRTIIKALHQRKHLRITPGELHVRHQSYGITRNGGSLGGLGNHQVRPGRGDLVESLEGSGLQLHHLLLTTVDLLQLTIQSIILLLGSEQLPGQLREARPRLCFMTKQLLLLRLQGVELRIGEIPVASDVLLGAGRTPSPNSSGSHTWRRRRRTVDKGAIAGKPRRSILAARRFSAGRGGLVGISANWRHCQP